MVANTKKIHQIVFISVMLFTAGFTAIGFTSAENEDLVPFVVATANGPGKLDPLDAYDSESIETIMQVCEGLYIYNYSSPEMEVIPNIAAELGKWSPDMKNLTISLRHKTTFQDGHIVDTAGVTFHDGTPLKAAHVKWNFDRLQYWTYGFDINGNGTLVSEPAGTASMTLFKIGDDVILNRTEIVDEYTIKFVLNIPCVIWEKLLAFVACSIILPDIQQDGNCYYGNTFFNRITMNDDLIGTGPFKLTEYDLDNQVEFDWNQEYHMEWNNQHIYKMIYLIIPDWWSYPPDLSNVHWGGVLGEYTDQFDADPDLVQVRRKASVVYFQQMNLYNMKPDIRYATTFAWNHSYWLDETLGGRHFELHVPIPDGMQYHHSGFDGEPYYDLETARNILLTSPDSEIHANITVNNLTAQNTTEEWRAVATTLHPVAWFNYTRYQSGTVELASLQLQDNLKDIGIRLEILEPINWTVWVTDYLNTTTGYKRLAYSFGGWGPDYNDPITMIDQLYATNASSNCFGLDNATWNQKLLDTYSTTGLERQNLFYEIQEEFCKIQIPSMYILQLGGSVSFNKKFVDEDSIGDLLNIFSDLYWFNVIFLGNPPISPDTEPKPYFSLNPFEISMYGFLILLGSAIGTIIFVTLRNRYREN